VSDRIPMSAVAKQTGLSVRVIRHYAELPSDHPDHLPHYAFPDKRGATRRQFDPDEVRAWMEAHYR
jgi:hypothetical protein